MPPASGPPCLRALVVLLFALATAPLAAQDPPSDGIESEDLFDRPAGETAPSNATVSGPRESEAAQAYAEGDLARAIAIYRELGTSDPDPAERARLRTTAAWLLFEQGDRSSAGLELRQILYETPDLTLDPQLYSADFVGLFQNSQLEAANARRRTAVQKLEAALAAESAGDHALARRLANESLQLRPLHPRTVYTLAKIDLADGRTEEALAGFEKLLALERATGTPLPADLKALALNNVGVIYLERSQYEDAAQALETSVRLAPGDARSWFNLALARLALERRIEGIDALRRAHQIDRADAEISLQLARTYEQTGSWVEAVALLVEATGAHPDRPLLWLELGRAQRGLGNAAGAETSLRRALESDPANAAGAGAPAALQLAESEISRNAFAAAVPDAAAATRFEPENGTAWAILGRAQQGAGDLAAAATSLARALELEPERADFAYNLGTVYLAQNRIADAENLFDRALTLDPAAREPALALARLQEARGTGRTATVSGRRAEPAPRNAPPPRELGARLAPVDYAPLGIRGLIVQAVTKGSLAARAGLEIDDLVLRGDGQPLTQVPTLMALVRNPEARSLQLSVLRAGRPVEIVLPLD
ncbi:MAG: tetratricopeptide repeat protein [Thermoanaerobaculia bacterium]